jgi:hypothetical protein
MPNLFDMLKSGLGVFGGPGTPGQLAGAAMMQASGPGSTGMQAIGAGIETGVLARQALEEQERLNQGRLGVEMMLADVGYDRSGLQRAFAMSLGSGDVEGARMLSELIKSLPDPPADRVRNLQAREALNPETGLVEWASFDPVTGTMTFTGVRPPPKEESEYDMADPTSSTGYRRVRVVDGALIPGQEVAGPGGGAAGGGTEAERLRSGLGQQAAMFNADLERLDHILIDPKMTLFNMAQGWEGSATVARMLAPEMANAWSTAQAFINPVVRYFSGAQMTEAEAKRLMGSYLPLAGESNDVRLKKRRYRQAVIRAMNNGAGVEEFRRLETQFGVTSNPEVADAVWSQVPSDIRSSFADSVANAESQMPAADTALPVGSAAHIEAWMAQRQGN